MAFVEALADISNQFGGLLGGGALPDTGAESTVPVSPPSISPPASPPMSAEEAAKAEQEEAQKLVEDSVNALNNVANVLSGLTEAGAALTAEDVCRLPLESVTAS